MTIAVGEQESRCGDTALSARLRRARVVRSVDQRAWGGWGVGVGKLGLGRMVWRVEALVFCGQGRAHVPRSTLMCFDGSGVGNSVALMLGYWSRRRPQGMCVCLYVSPRQYHLLYLCISPGAFSPACFGTLASRLLLSAWRRGG